MTIRNSSEFNFNDVFKEFLSNFSDFILFINNSGIIEKYIGKINKNEGAKREIVGENIEDLFSGKISTQLTNRLIQNIRDNNQSLKITLRIKNDVFHYKIKVVLYDNERNIIFFRNITESQKIVNHINVEREKYHSMLENSHAGIWIIDKEAYTLYVNNRMCNLFGYNKHEMLGKHLFDFMSPESKKKATNLLQSRQEGVKEQHRFEFLKKDGNNIFTRLETSPILNKEGNYDGAIAIVSDITNLVHSE
ncbi:MAG: PAS domain S-box protein, partial [Candidatus Lokiarchaeota archaeon]|nr:PAS domain S-box protein [Candidatus Lokiarchaeota archaeon]MBD3202397.1 PAS domain S-box protein [Candidatus Lokiarchaeota archaeon]